MAVLQSYAASSFLGQASYRLFVCDTATCCVADTVLAAAAVEFNDVMTYYADDQQFNALSHINI